MNKAGAGDWRTPLGYYEKAIEELRRTREEIQTELQNLKEPQTSEVELQNLKAELQSSQAELQYLKAELQTTKDRLATTQQTAESAQARVATAENAANATQTELQALKAELQNMNTQQTENNAQAFEGLSQLKEQLSEVLSQLQQIQQQQIFFKDDFKTQICQSLSELRSQISKVEDELTLISSASGADYTQLRNLLAAGDWKKADEKTRAFMLRGCNREREGWLDRGEIERFPWQDFRIINRLWVEYSNGRFGFSVQYQIWQSVEVEKNDDFEVEKSLGYRVGWRVNKNWLSYNNFTFTLSAAKGHLPSTLHLLGVGQGRVEDRIKFLFSRRDLQA